MFSALGRPVAVKVPSFHRLSRSGLCARQSSAAPNVLRIVQGNSITFRKTMAPLTCESFNGCRFGSPCWPHGQTLAHG